MWPMIRSRAADRRSERHRRAAKCLRACPQITGRRRRSLTGGRRDHMSPHVVGTVLCRTEARLRSSSCCGTAGLAGTPRDRFAMLRKKGGGALGCWGDLECRPDNQRRDENG